jgi:hypothetical protein
MRAIRPIFVAIVLAITSLSAATGASARTLVDWAASWQRIAP